MGDFDDVDLNGFGALDGDGAKSHHTAREQRRSDGKGIDYSVACGNCGQPIKVGVEWDEFIYMSVKKLPPGWEYNPKWGAFYPNIGCPSCKALVALTFTPDEANRQLKAGVLGGAITPEYIQRGQHVVLQRASQMRQ